MEIKFRDKNIRELCEKRNVSMKKLGAPCARKLQLRLLQLEAAGSVTDLVAGKPHQLSGDRSDEYAVSLHAGYRLTFSPANNPRPTKSDGGIDWSSVTIICIEYIGDYHD